MIVVAPFCSRTTSFFQKKREANREAEMLLKAEKENEVDVVERFEMYYLNSNRHKAMARESCWKGEGEGKVEASAPASALGQLENQA